MLRIQACHQLASWFKSVGVDAQVVQGEDWDSSVIIKPYNSGIPYTVIVLEKGGLILDNKFATIPMKYLKKHKEIKDIVHKISLQLGYGKVNPVDRGEELENKPSYSEEFDLVAFRHCETRRVPNPPPETFAKYNSTLNMTTRQFFHSNVDFCLDFRLDVDDLLQYARIWLCNFDGLYHREDKDDVENGKLLYAYLRQRFAEFRNTYIKKIRNMIPDPDTFCTSILGRPYSGSKTDEISDSTLLDDAIKYMSPIKEYVDTIDKLKDEMNPEPIKSRVTLESEFAKISHAAQIEELTRASHNLFIAPEASSKARDMLNHHMKTCKECKSVGEVEENMAWTDLYSLPEYL